MMRPLVWLGVVTTLSCVAPAWAEPKLLSDGACADAVDFAMRTAEHRDAGKSRDEISRSIHDSLMVFKQQYPDLDESDMQLLLAQVFDKGWTRFNAAKTTARDCARRLRPSGPLVLRDKASAAVRS